MSDQALAGRAASAVRSNALAMPIVLVLGLVGTALVAHSLTAEALAAYLVILAARGTIQFLTDLGSGTATARAIATMEERGAGRAALRVYQRLFTLRACIVAIGVAAVVAMPNFARDLLNDEVTDTALVLIVIMLAAEVMASLGFYALAGLLQHQRANGIAIAQGILQPTLVVVLVSAGFGLTGAVIALAVASVMRCVALHVFGYRALRRLARERPGDDASADEPLAEPLALMPTAVASSVGKFAAFAHSRQGLSLLAVSAVEPKAFILFALGYDLTHQVLTPIGTPVSTVMGPALSSLGDEDRSAAAVGTSIRIMLLAAFGAAGCFVIGLAFADGTLFGSKFTGLDPYILILAPAVAIEMAMAIPLASAMLSHDRWLPTYRRIKLVTLAAVVIYVVVGLEDILLVLAIMATVRAASAIAMAVAYSRGTERQVVAASWYLRIVGAIVISGALGSLAAEAIGGLVGGIVGALVYAVAYFVCIRQLGLVLERDLAVVGRVAPGVQERAARVLAARPTAPST